MRKLYLDLDGVIADFDRYFPELFNLDHRGMAGATLRAIEDEWRYSHHAVPA